MSRRLCQSDFASASRVFVVMAATCLGCVGPLTAQTPLYKQSPFDLVVLKTAVEEGKAFRVMPLELANRRLPSNPSGTLKVRLVDDASKERAVQWRLIERVELFEDMVLREAQSMVAANRLDDAFESFAFLKQQYPGAEGLTRAYQDYLFTSGATLYSQARYFEALAALEVLYEESPEYEALPGRTVLAALSVVCDKVLAYYIAEKQDMENGRRLLLRLSGKFGDRLGGVVKWRRELLRQATAKRDELSAQLAAGQLREAHQTGREMLRLWPDVPGGLELADEASRRFPVVIVGVTDDPVTPDVSRLDCWTARRLGRLQQRILMEFLGPGPEGGMYQCPWGIVERSAEDPTKFQIELRKPRDPETPSPTGYDLARLMLQQANPQVAGYVPAWASLLETVEVKDVYQVQVSLTRPSVLPESLLRIGMSENVDAFTPYLLEEKTPQQSRYLLNAKYSLGGPTQPAQITERRFDDTVDALEALRKGEIDVIDRLFPAQAAALIGDPEIMVGEYAAPSLHVLIPNYDNPFLANRTFRRALVYGISREEILTQVLLEGKALAGCRVISAPLPAGKSRNDSMSYAYNEDLQPHPYDPRQAFFLVQLALKEMEALAEMKKEEPPKLKPLVLGHPATKAARAVCSVMVTQLKLIDLEVTLKEFPPGVTRDESGECDLVYAEVVMFEPLTDARRILGPAGLAKVANPFVALALRRLDQADDWRRVSARLGELHAILHHDVAVVPLWQIIEHYAYQPGISGLGDRPSNLYQEVEQWRISPRIVE